MRRSDAVTCPRGPLHNANREIKSIVNFHLVSQTVLFRRSHRVFSWGAGDGALLRCRGNRKVQETSICGAAGFKSDREVLSGQVLL